MTLILTVANKNGVHQLSDFQLTDPKTGTPDRGTAAGSKQLEASFGSLRITLAFTGLARVSNRKTIDWLADELKALPRNSTLQDICAALQKRCTSELVKLGPSAFLIVVLAASELDKPHRIATVSNSDWGRNPPIAKSGFEIQIHTISRPFRLISGYRAAVTQRDRQRLKVLSRDMNFSQEETARIQNALTEINVAAAKNSNGWISENCWAVSQFLDGETVHSQGRNIGPQDGVIRHISEGFDMSDFIQKNFRVAPGQKPRVVQMAGVIAGPGGMKSIPPPQGELTFSFSGSSSAVTLFTPSGEPCAALKLTRLKCTVTARLNEEVIVPFAEVELTSPQIRADFPAPLLPWPHLDRDLFLNGIPLGFHQTVGHWIEGAAIKVAFPRSSKGIRKIAFLGDHDELVLATTDEVLLELTSEQTTQTATINARIHWRVRMDGTSG